VFEAYLPVCHARANVLLMDILRGKIDFNIRLQNQLLCEKQIVFLPQPRCDIAMFTDEQMRFGFKPLRASPLIPSVRICSGFRLGIVANTCLCIPERRDVAAIECPNSALFQLAIGTLTL
jgi:hypothetical protein